MLRALYGLASAYWFLRRPKTHGAYVAVWVGDTLLCLQNTYRREITVPSGGIRPGEPPLAAAVRELWEEVGISLAPERLSFAGGFTRAHEFKEDTGFFFDIRFPVRPSVRIDEVEVAWADFIRPETIDSAVMSPLLAAYLAVGRRPDQASVGA
jgi:8-oxo-dGTP pyrophosphatase MutT (NUDIX family)